MLLSLSISNIATVDHLEVNFQRGLTVITGESGAGKSVLLKALGLVLGNRADTQTIRPGTDQAEIHGSFSLNDSPDAKHWLKIHDLLQDNECLLRRVITREGRSKAYINNRPVPLHDLKLLGSHLIDTYSQHAHYSLLKKDQQRKQLDAYADLTQDTLQLSEAVQCYQKDHQQYQHLQCMEQQESNHAALLDYQLQELNELAIVDNEFDELDRQHKLLANGEQLLKTGHDVVALCRNNDHSALSILNQALQHLRPIANQMDWLNETEQLLSTAAIQIEEAISTLQNGLNNFHCDPEQLRTIEDRLTALHHAARKYRVTIRELGQLQDQLVTERQQMTHHKQQLEVLHQKLQKQRSQYTQLAQIISKKRQAAAITLQDKIVALLTELSMAHCRFTVALTARESKHPHPYGNEDIEYLISTNTDHLAQPLSRIASGGELSRIGLAIQVATAQTASVSTLVFDEVDVGISGATTQAIGDLLQTLSRHKQIICVTHQAQVASKGDHHLVVDKRLQHGSAFTSIRALTHQEKIQEIARMIGGNHLTEPSKAYAAEILNDSD